MRIQVTVIHSFITPHLPLPGRPTNRCQKPGHPLFCSSGHPPAPLIRSTPIEDSAFLAICELSCLKIETSGHQNQLTAFKNHSQSSNNLKYQSSTPKRQRQNTKLEPTTRSRGPAAEGLGPLDIYVYIESVCDKVWCILQVS